MHDDPRAVAKLIEFLYTSDYSYNDSQLSNSTFSATTVTASHELLLHTQVYVLAEKYDVPALKVLASKKFHGSLPTNGPTNAFVASLELMFTQTPENDRLLKDLALGFAGKKYRELANRTDFIALCRNNGDVASEVIKAIASTSTEPQYKGCPTCNGSSHYVHRSAPFQLAYGLYSCYTCRKTFS